MLFLSITFIGVIVLVGIWIVVMYNRFITLAERVENAKAQIAAQIESRWDAVKNLITATKEYAQYESELLENITEQRVSIGKLSSTSSGRGSFGGGSGVGAR